jgi:glutamate dehydrogenase (NAD(P)+)
MVALQAARDFGIEMKGATVAIQGFGNVGSWAAHFFNKEGAKVIAVSDVKGGIHNPDGLDIPSLLKYVAQNKTVVGFPGTTPVTQNDLLTLECDLLVPAALGGVITRQRASKLRCRMVIEAANSPTSPLAEDILAERGIVVVPDVLVNAGGVIVSYLEWTQNLQQFQWDLERVNDILYNKITTAYQEVYNISQERRVSMRTAAYIVAIDKVARACSLRGH